MKNFFNGIFVIVAVVWMLLTDREQRELYNVSIGEAEDKGE